MNFLSALALGATLFSSIFAEEEVKHHRPCLRCSKEEAEKVVRGYQQIIEQAAVTDNAQLGRSLSQPEGGFAMLDPICPGEPCCLTIGNFDLWWTYYHPWDQVVYPYAPSSFEHLSNGTIIVTKYEFTGYFSGPDFNRSLNSYGNSWYWNPVASENGCDYRLAYIYTWNLLCPHYVANPLSSEVCFENCAAK